MYFNQSQDKLTAVQNRNFQPCVQELLMPDYRSQDSIPKKREMIEAAFGNHVPDYLLFHLWDISSLDGKTVGQVIGLFFEEKTPRFGDVELHCSHAFTDSYLKPSPGFMKEFTVLRIRGATKMRYMLEIAGHECHLIQAKNRDSDRRVNFLDLWGLSPLDPRREPGEDRIGVCRTHIIAPTPVFDESIDSPSDQPTNEVGEPASPDTSTEPAPSTTPKNKQWSWSGWLGVLFG